MAQFRYVGETGGIGIDGQPLPLHLAAGFASLHPVLPDDVFTVPDDEAEAYAYCEQDGTPNTRFEPVDAAALEACETAQAEARAAWAKAHPAPPQPTAPAAPVEVTVTTPPPATPQPVIQSPEDAAFLAHVEQEIAEHEAQSAAPAPAPEGTPQ